MSIALKDMNRPVLALVVVVNAALYYVIYRGELHWEAIESLSQNVEALAPLAGVSALTGLLNAQLSAIMKARLVFWRWSHPLPGSKAFTEIAIKDPRVDPKVLEARHGSFPTDPADQNRLWYRWYRHLQDDPAVSHAHREYLLTRDWAGISFIMLFTLVPLGFYQMSKEMTLILGVFLQQNTLLYAVQHKIMGSG